MSRGSFRSRDITRYGTTALITGASSGIGASFAWRLAAEGCSELILVARRLERLNSLKAEIEERYHCKVIPLEVDLSLAGSGGVVQELLERERISGVDILVNNAGFGLLGAFDDLPQDRLAAMVELNCLAVVDLTRRFLPAMKRRGCGAIIITSSVVGALPAPWFSVYSATKAFDLYFGEALHGECVGSGVDVLTVLPGLTRTEFHAGLGERSYHSPYRSAEQVVDTALRALGRRSIAVDGWYNKLLCHGSRFLPRGVALWLSRRVMRFEVGVGLAPGKSG
jgi:short-subunit dehydrogenase